ncbi:BZ3500_MvSof-1268-A1-R1_Chr4-1g06669 [Microbotryum saponariae]|uniref:BZ3500_MvSof-1268-A1-R1_Chr4-1g06669 protein n=1 Tax=Microbotryum saponariae TaxID=289078 RepID=A0A2X0KXU2_9BASI|nr:BZ3500_MvSof-1268-A1-R1_Chr4-1g06669 [Microbotryum saponariae]SDA06334.1 BZ3501_MvSof-1269-A2-R1_Chr4-1g06379 [Microbotryum saponariae]
MPSPSTALPTEEDALPLLPFQRSLLQRMLPRANVSDAGSESESAAATTSAERGDALLLIARGLGMRTIVATMLRIYDTSTHLLLVVNATPEEERGLAQETGIHLKSVGFEVAAETREKMYKQGGLFSVTSRILVVDMLNNKIPVVLITGIIVLHAETVTPTSLEAFIVRIYRRHNRVSPQYNSRNRIGCLTPPPSLSLTHHQIGFLKAFSDQPEQFTFGLSPLQTVLQQLKLREVIICPRFHADVDRDLQKRKADVVELYQPLTDTMLDIQGAIIECMEATLSEIKRSNTYLEVEDLTVENALFRSFDGLVRSRLDPVWHKVGSRTKLLVQDLTLLRKLQAYLLALDCVSFNRFLETILTSQASSSSLTTNGNATALDKKDRSPWLYTTAADTIFTVAQKRVYVKKPKVENGREEESVGVEGEVIPDDLGEDEWGFDEPTEEEEEMLRAIESGVDVTKLPLPTREAPTPPAKKMANPVREEDEEVPLPAEARPIPNTSWLPPNIEPVLEEQPKWYLLAQVLEEIETDIERIPADPFGYSSDTILIMCNSSETCQALGDYLEARAEDAGRSKDMLLNKLNAYFFWKGAMGKMNQTIKKDRSPQKPSAARSSNSNSTGGGGGSTPTPYGGPINQALKRKMEMQRGQVPSQKRRRVRGGGTINVADRASSVMLTGANPEALEVEANEVAQLLDASQAFAKIEEGGTTPAFMLSTHGAGDLPLTSEIDLNRFDETFGLLDNEDLVLIRPYSDDDDDKVLEELRPKYVVLFDPDPAFVRRLETYRALHQGLALRVYFLTYKDSVEEQRYLSSIRKEKDAFERLIRERGSMAIPHEAEYRPNDEEYQSTLLRTTSTRKGGSRNAEVTPSKVIIDVREFRSSLPSLLHEGGFDIEPLTISIGDYVLSPEMCVERKSLPDLIGSFNSGRLYQQCEIMSAHYKTPILLIEFDEKKSFNLETYVELRPKGESFDFDLRSKLVLLTIAFPRLKTIWSSSPYQTVEIFRELKENRPEPDPTQALLIGADDSTSSLSIEGSGFSIAPQEILRSLPGVTTKNYRYVMNRVDSVESLCELDLGQMQELIGVEAGRTLWKFVNRNVADED